MLPDDEHEKNETWFKAKVLSVQECSKSVSEYLKSVACDNENDFDGNEIKPVDSASNISHKSTRSSRSTTSSVLRAQAEAK